MGYKTNKPKPIGLKYNTQENLKDSVSSVPGDREWVEGEVMPFKLPRKTES